MLSSLRTMLKLVFVFRRLNDNKVMAPVIHEALNRGHQVEAWLDQRDISQSTKWYEYPDAAKMPRYHPTLQPHFRTFLGSTELGPMLAKSDADWHFFQSHPEVPKPPGKRWAHVVSCFYDTLCGTKMRDFGDYDVTFFNTQHWIEAGIRYYEITEELKRGGAEELNFRKTWLTTGTTQFDQFKFCDRNKIRSQLGLLPSDKVVIVFAFELTPTFWCQKIFREHRLWRRLWNVLVMPASYPHFRSKLGLKRLPILLWRSLVEKPELIWQALTSASELEVLRAIRAFCDKNGMKFVLKARKKHPLDDYYHEYPDVVVSEDRDYFPNTASQVIAASDLLMTFFSTAAAEAAANGVPSLNFVPPKLKFYTLQMLDLIYRKKARENAASAAELYYNVDPETVFNFPGVVQSWSVNRVRDELMRASASDFALDPARHAEFLRKFVYPAGRESASSILSALESRA